MHISWKHSLAAAAILSALALVAACVAPTGDSRPSATDVSLSQAPTHTRDLVYIRNMDQRSDLVAVDADTGKEVARFPWGVTTPDGSLLYRAELDNGETAIRAIDLANNATTAERRIKLVGSSPYEVPTVGVIGQPGGFSPNARWLALNTPTSDYSSDGAKIHFVVVDSKLQQPSKFIDLPSNFTFDAISDSGQSLYLEEHVGANGSSGYRVRVYDLQAGQLTQGIVVDKAVGTDAMNGVRVGTIASPDGAWQYTLYWRQGGNPFIHAIKLEERWSLCLVLPVQTSGEEDFAWSFVASPDGRTAYAINSLKGYVASVNLISATVIKTATLDVPRSSAPNLVDQVAQFFFPVAEAKSEMFSLAVVSPDSKTLYASGDYGRKLFAIATDTLAIKNTFTFASLSGAPLQMTALGLSPDGLRLYAIDAEGGALMHLDASTGRTLAQVKLTGTNGGRIVRVVHR